MSGISNTSDIFRCLSECGVGIIYSPSVQRLDIPDELIDTIEIEPQTLCIKDPSGHLKIPEKVFKDILALPYNKLVHSIGAPVGGSLLPEADQIALINYSANLFKSPWVTEHLSFNATTEFNTGFFLPPCQTDEGLELTIKNIKYLQSELNRPLAIETGVNYLKPNSYEMEDGLFVSEICKATGCGILLDIHNLFANQLNGRQSIEEFIKQIPVDLVVEVHIAGGTTFNELWLDSHSGPIDDRLMRLTAAFLPEFKNLKAITYEVFDSYVPVVGAKTISGELERIRDLWEGRSKFSGKEKHIPENARFIQEMNRSYNQPEWETSLANQVIGREPTNNLSFISSGNEERIRLYQYLINEFRAGMVTRIFKLTCTYMMLVLGMDVFSIIIKDFWKQYPPEQLSYKEAQHFAEYLQNKQYKLPWLYRLLDYEEATLNTLLKGTIHTVTFDMDPTPMFRALTEGKLPDTLGKSGIYEIEITPESQSDIQWLTMNS